MLWILPALAETPLWDEVALAAGKGAWDDVKSLHFQWSHLPTGRVRTYDWNVPAGEVTVRLAPDAPPTTVPVVPDQPLQGDALAAHQAFVNDQYWLLFEQHAATDAAQRATVPVDDAPFPGTQAAYEVRYPSEGGYTPGDRYVVWVGANHTPTGWSYFPGGAPEPKVTCTREAWVSTHGLKLPTRFVKPDGTALIAIDDLRVE